MDMYTTRKSQAGYQAAFASKLGSYSWVGVHLVITTKKNEYLFRTLNIKNIYSINIHPENKNPKGPQRCANSESA